VCSWSSVTQAAALASDGNAAPARRMHAAVMAPLLQTDDAVSSRESAAEVVRHRKQKLASKSRRSKALRKRHSCRGSSAAHWKSTLKKLQLVQHGLPDLLLLQQTETCAVTCGL
jgi:hypothetical protein